MGYDLTRFVGDEVDEELVCPICSGVLDDPVQAPLCEHAFCSGCISEWIRRQATCPVDRNAISIAQLKPVPRILKNLLARLEISCDNADYGCTATLKLEFTPRTFEGVRIQSTKTRSLYRRMRTHRSKGRNEST